MALALVLLCLYAGKLDVCDNDGVRRKRQFRMDRNKATYVLETS